MRLNRSTILAILAVGCCTVGLSLMVCHSSRVEPDVQLLSHGLQTNRFGELQAAVSVTNRANRRYAITFAMQSGPAGQWATPSMTEPPLSPLFKAYGSDELHAKSRRDFLLPISPTNASCRIVAAYWEPPPESFTGKLWWIPRALLKGRRGFVKFLTTPALQSNKAASRNSGLLVPFACPPDRPAASEPRCWART